MKILASSALSVLFLIGPSTGASSDSHPAGADAPRVLTAAQWREDLAYLVETLETVHPDLYARVDREEFAQSAAELAEAIPTLSSPEITVRLMQLVALVEDGHTSLEPVDPAGFGRWFPVRFYRFLDGIFVTAAAAEHAELVGARVVRIGSMPAEAAWELVATLHGSDNELGSLQTAPLYLSNAAALAALGVIDSPGRMTVVFESDGEPPQTITVEAIDAGFDLSFQFWGEIWGPASTEVEYVSSTGGRSSNDHYDTESDLPLHLRYRSAYWFTYLAEQKLFYVQINYLGDSRKETFAQFFDRLWRAVDDAEIDQFVLDNRYNIGGDGSLVRKFVHEIIKRDDLNRSGKLFTVVGRATFSAGVMLTAAMDEHTETVFVGEPMGAYYKHYGDGTSFELPHSGLQAWVSTIYHQLDDYVDDARTLPIQLPAQFTSKAYFGGRDPALEQILEARSRPPLTVVFREQGAKAALAEYEKRRAELGKIDWWAPFTLSELNSLGNEFREAERWEEAMAAYRLNAARHPDHWRVWYSLGRACKEQGQVEAAIEYYEKALAADPFNNLAPNQREALEELRAPRG